VVYPRIWLLLLLPLLPLLLPSFCLLPGHVSGTVLALVTEMSAARLGAHESGVVVCERYRNAVVFVATLSSLLVVMLSILLPCCHYSCHAVVFAALLSSLLPCCRLCCHSLDSKSPTPHSPPASISAPSAWAGTEENNELCNSTPGPACPDSGNIQNTPGEGFIHVEESRGRDFHRCTANHQGPLRPSRAPVERTEQRPVFAKEFAIWLPC